MPRKSLDSTVIEILNDLKLGQGKSEAFHQDLKSDVEHIKTSVEDLCDRTTKMEQQKIDLDKHRDGQIALLKACMMGMGGLVSLFQGLSFLKHGF